MTDPWWEPRMKIFDGYPGLLKFRINLALGMSTVTETTFTLYEPLVTRYSDMQPQRVTIEADEEPPQTLEGERDGVWWRAELVWWDEGECEADYMVGQTCN